MAHEFLKKIKDEKANLVADTDPTLNLIKPHATAIMDFSTRYLDNYIGGGTDIPLADYLERDRKEVNRIQSLPDGEREERIAISGLNLKLDDANDVLEALSGLSNFAE